MQRRIITIDNHPVQVSIEGQFWDCLEDIAQYRGKTLTALVADIAEQLGGDLPSALRVYVLSYYQRGYEKPDHGRVFH